MLAKAGQTDGIYLGIYHANFLRKCLVHLVYRPVFFWYNLYVYCTAYSGWLDVGPVHQLTLAGIDVGPVQQLTLAGIDVGPVLEMNPT